MEAAHNKKHVLPVEIWLVPTLPRPSPKRPRHTKIRSSIKWLQIGLQKVSWEIELLKKPLKSYRAKKSGVSWVTKFQIGLQPVATRRFEVRFQETKKVEPLQNWAIEKFFTEYFFLILGLLL